jgi:TP901 family phage tail tape measure protein
MLFGGNRSISVLLSVNPAGVRAGLAVAKREMSDFAKAGVEASQQHKRSYDEVAQSAVGIGVALTAAAGVAVAAFARFDKSMSRAQAATQGTASEMTALREAAIKAGQDTAFSATEAADGITEMAKAGVSVRDILGGGLAGTLSLAAAGELEVARAAEIAASTMTQFALKGSDLGHVADVLAAGAGKAQGSVNDLAQGLKYAGPVAASMGVSLEQTVGVLAKFAAQGIVGEQAGTSLRGVLLSMTPTSKAAAATMKELGIEMFDANGKFIGLDGAANELQQGLSGLSDAQATAALKTIFGNEQVTAAVALYKDGAGAVQQWERRVNDAGYASRQAGQLMNNLAGDLEELKGSVETAFISTGAGANEGLRTLTQGATSVVNAFGAIPDSLQRATVVAVGLTGVVVTLGGGMAILAAKTAAAKASMTELGVSATAATRTLRILGTGIAAISAVQVLPGLAESLDKTVGTVSNDASELEKSLSSLAKTGKASGEVARLFGEDFAGAGSAWNKFSGGFFVTGESVADTIDRLSEKNRGLIDGFLHWGDSTQSGAKNIQAVGDALAKMVADGKADEASQAFRTFAEGAGLSGDEMNKLLPLMPAYRDALEQVRKQAGDASVTVEGLARGEKTAAQAAKEAAEATNALTAAASEFTNVALGARGSAREYEAALDAVTASVKANGKSLDITTEKGRENQAALDAIAESGLAYAEATYKQTGSGERFRKVLERTRADLIQAARRFGLTRQQADAYADKVLQIPSKAETQIITRGLAEANRRLDDFVERLAIVNGKVVRVRVEANAANVREGRTANLGSPSAARATGGILPGPPSRRDNMVIAAASGEFVVNAAQTARHRPLLEAINSGRLPGFAEGGFVDVSPFSVNDAFERYQSRLPKPITPQQVTSALRAATQAEDRRKNAALALRNAERDLYVIRHKHPKNIQGIKDAEDRLDRARRSYASARANETAKERAAADAIRRRNAPRGFDLGQFGASLLTTVKQTEAYRRQLSAIEKRGGVSGKRLADYLAGMGAEGAPLVAALVKADARTFTRILQLLRRLDPEAFAKQTGESVTRFANGGIQPHYATGLRLYGEPETGGEAYIPLAASKRTRSKMLAEDVVARMGGAVAWSSHRVQPAGSSVSAAPSQQGRSGDGPLVSVENLHLVRGTPEQVGSELMFAVRTRGG